MKGYVVQRDNRYYAVIYEGLDPATGREQRRWHPAGRDRDEAERLVARLADQRRRRPDGSAGLSFGPFLTARWLPAKRLSLRPTTFARYDRSIHHYVLPDLGRVPLRRLRTDHLEDLYRRLLEDGRCDGEGLAPKTVLNLHVMVRSALGDTCRRGLIARNVAEGAAAPTLRSVPKAPMRSWTAAQLGQFLAAAKQHWTFPALWLAAATGMRRGEVLGLHWEDVDLDAGALSVTRSLCAVGYELDDAPLKTRSSRRSIDLDARTVLILTEWRDIQRSRGLTGGAAFTKPDGTRIHPHVFSQTFERIAARADVPPIRLHDLRHTHATLLLKAGVPLKVVSERLGHASPAFTMTTYQHVLPGMQAEAAKTFAALVAASTEINPVDAR